MTDKDMQEVAEAIDEISPHRPKDSMSHDWDRADSETIVEAIYPIIERQVGKQKHTEGYWAGVDAALFSCATNLAMELGGQDASKSVLQFRKWLMSTRDPNEPV